MMAITFIRNQFRMRGIGFYSGLTIWVGDVCSRRGSLKRGLEEASLWGAGWTRVAAPHGISTSTVLPA